ncbi:MAG: galactose mutarotase [Clostridia bacterium]|nr:galactose mutarotase [Clostridia bacterium]
MNKRLFGTLPCGTKIAIFTLTHGKSSAEIMTYGAAIVSLRPFGNVDVVGGYDCIEDYLADTSNQGAIIGRVANRIEGACFKMDNKVYHLVDNDNGNCLHGGGGFHQKVWQVNAYTQNSVTLSYYSPDGEDGFPAGLPVCVKYTLEDSALCIDYTAKPEGKTPIALTNHAYFNLDGFGKDIRKHKIQIAAERYTEVDERLIPNGNRPPVASTSLDFRKSRLIDDGTDAFTGYDHNMILSPTSFRSFHGVSLGLAAQAENDRLTLQVYTDQPGLQFYTGNFLGDGPCFKNGVPPIQYGAFCLEAQTEPNCIKKGIAIYDKGTTYSQHTVYKFNKLG